VPEGTHWTSCASRVVEKVTVIAGAAHDDDVTLNSYLEKSIFENTKLYFKFNKV
jgi:hypothetical protein